MMIDKFKEHSVKFKSLKNAAERARINVHHLLLSINVNIPTESLVLF